MPPRVSQGVLAKLRLNVKKRERVCIRFSRGNLFHLDRISTDHLPVPFRRSPEAKNIVYLSLPSRLLNGKYFVGAVNNLRNVERRKEPCSAALAALALEQTQCPCCDGMDRRHATWLSLDIGRAHRIRDWPCVCPTAERDVSRPHFGMLCRKLLTLPPLGVSHGHHGAMVRWQAGRAGWQTREEV